MTYMAAPQHKNPCPGIHEIYNFGRPFLGHHYYILSLSDLYLEVEKKIFKENRNTVSNAHKMIPPVPPYFAYFTIGNLKINQIKM